MADQKEVIKALADLGAMLDYENKNHNTALTMAVASSRLNSIHALAACGAVMDYETQERKTALLLGVELEQTEALFALIAGTRGRLPSELVSEETCIHFPSSSWDGDGAMNLTMSRP